MLFYSTFKRLFDGELSSVEAVKPETLSIYYKLEK